MQPKKGVSITSETYEEYVDKFKTKCTKDDTFTPQNVYDTVRDWAVKEYGLEGREVVRPFWPDADFTKAEYPKGCVVIDNPPFSIQTKICKWYLEQGIDFFLFANHVTLFSTLRLPKVHAVIVGNSITFENGAKLPISYLTNMGADRVSISGELYELIKKATEVKENTHNSIKYPPNVISASRLSTLAKAGINHRIKNMTYWPTINQYHIFGGGGLISDNEVARLETARLRTVGRRVTFELSDKERAEIQKLNNYDVESD